jgi:hypothetical protein
MADSPVKVAKDEDNNRRGLRRRPSPREVVGVRLRENHLGQCRAVARMIEGGKRGCFHRPSQLYWSG